MVTVRVGDANVSILFKTDFNVSRLAKNGLEEVAQVSCALVGQQGRVIAGGNAFCSSKDDFDIPKGMEIALGRALQRLTPDKALRAKFWDVFNRGVAGQMLEDAREKARLEELLASSFDDLEDLDVERIPIIEAEYIPMVPPRTFEQQAALDTLREEVKLAEASHLNGWPSATCSYCNDLRSRLAALEAA